MPVTSVEVDMNDVLNFLQERINDIVPNGDLEEIEASVGFSAPYAIYVHENLEANHPNGGEAKFLENAIKDNADSLGDLIAYHIKRRKTLRYAVYRAAVRVLQEAKKRVPVDTGFLKKSGYVQE